LAPARETRRVLKRTLLFCVILALWFGSLEYRKLVKPDEGRYAEIPREMVTTGDWITPRLNGLKYFEKPPLQYWVTATAFTLFGEHQWTARLWSALTGLLGVLTILRAGSALFGAEAGLYAACALGSSFFYAGMAQLNTLDTGLTFFMTLALAAFLLAQRPGTTGRRRLGLMLVVWAAVGLAVMSKGLIGLVLPGAVLAIDIALRRDLAMLRRLHLRAGMAVMTLVAAPWFIAVSIANPEFPKFFFVHEHLQRFLTTVHQRTEPVLFFVPFLVLGMTPWAATMIVALARAWKAREPAGGLEPRRFLLIYAAFIFLFFSLSQSKLPPYILPIFPAIALLVGDHLARSAPRALFRQTIPMAGLAVVMAGLSPLALTYSKHAVPVELLQRCQSWLVAVALTLLAATLYALREFHLGRVRRGVIGLAAGGLLMTQMVLVGFETLSPIYSTCEVAAKIRPALDPAAPFYSVKMYDQTLTFYLKRTVTLVDFADEMAFGLEGQPDHELPTLADFEARWIGDAEAYALMTPETYALLVRKGLPMTVMTSDARRVIVRR